MYARIFGILSIAAMTACGGSGSNPVTGGDADDGAVTDPGTDPSTTNNSFLFDPNSNLIANQFTYTPGATPAEDRVVINNLPFDGVSSEGGAYTRRAGVTLPSGEVFEATPSNAAEDEYLAVVLVSPNGTGALVGAVGTNAYRGFGYGGGFASRPSGSSLPASRTAAYEYEGEYSGVRVVRNEGAGAIQLTTGTSRLQVDVQDLDVGGAIKGRVTGRQLFDENGNPLGALRDILLNETRLDRESASTVDGGGVADTRNTDDTTAQSGSWEGLFSGPDGAEIVGYLVVTGTLSDTDVSQNADGDVTGREVGGFILDQQ